MDKSPEEISKEIKILLKNSNIKSATVYLKFKDEADLKEVIGLAGRLVDIAYNFAYILEAVEKIYKVNSLDFLKALIVSIEKSKMNTLN